MKLSSAQFMGLLACCAALFSAPSASAQARTRLKVDTNQAADCDALRLAGFSVDCTVDSSLIPRQPGKLTTLCPSANPEEMLTKVLGARQDFYVAGRLGAQELDISCATHDALLILAQPAQVEQEMALTSTGVLPAALRNVADSGGENGVSTPPLDLAPYPIRLSFSKSGFEPFCQTLRERWPLLTCNQNVAHGANAIMISCPDVPVDAVQILANLFQASFRTYEWRDDRGSCAQNYAIDVELVLLENLPTIETINLALNQPTQTILRGEVLAVLTPIASTGGGEVFDSGAFPLVQENPPMQEIQGEEDPELSTNDEDQVAVVNLEQIDSAEAEGESQDINSNIASDLSSETQAEIEIEPVRDLLGSQEAVATQETEDPLNTVETQTTVESLNTGIDPIDETIEPVAENNEPESTQEQVADTSQATQEQSEDEDLRIALRHFENLPVRLQFVDQIDEQLCRSLSDLGLKITCATNVSESKSNLMLRCGLVDPLQAAAFGNLIGLEGARLWDWRGRYDQDRACAQPDAFEIEIVEPVALNVEAFYAALSSAPGEQAPEAEVIAAPVVVLSQPTLAGVGPALTAAGQAGLVMEVHANVEPLRTEICAFYGGLGFAIECGSRLTEDRINLMLICDQLDDRIVEELAASLETTANGIRVYDWRGREGLAARACQTGPALVLEYYQSPE